jgi:hypothetical protein
MKALNLNSISPRSRQRTKINQTLEFTQRFQNSRYQLFFVGKLEVFWDFLALRGLTPEFSLF